MADEKRPAEFDERLRRLQQERGLIGPETDVKSVKGGYSQGMRAATDLVGGVLFGLGVGYGLDRWLNTSPWCLIGFFLLGTVAGFVNVYRGIAGYGYGVGYRKSSDTSKVRPPEA
jgi:ATP synthase protein I